MVASINFLQEALIRVGDNKQHVIPCPIDKIACILVACASASQKHDSLACGFLCQVAINQDGLPPRLLHPLLCLLCIVMLVPVISKTLSALSPERKRLHPARYVCNTVS